MTRNRQLEAIRAACIKANPNLEVRNTSAQVPEPFSGLINYRDRTTRLADVLLAIEATKYLVSFNLAGFGQFEIVADIENTEQSYARAFPWNLRQDNLTQQSDECITFLYELLK